MAWIKEYRVALLLACLKFILPFFIQDGSYELHRDEYLYLAEGQHPAWGYMEVPPLLSVFARLTAVLGNGFFWVKFWPSLFGALTVWTTCSLVREMGGKMYAQFLAGLCIIAGVYARINFLFQPNFLEIYWWTLLAFLLVKYANTRQPKFIYYLGIVAGLSFLSKYSLVFFAAGIGVGFLLSNLRPVFKSKHIYLAVLIALLIASPNIWWQYQHKWPVLYHMKELRQSQLVYVNPLNFIKDQFLMHFPYFFVWLIGLYYLLLNRRGRSFEYLGWIYLTVIILLIVSSGKSYYSLGVYPMLFAAGAVCLERWTATYVKWLRYLMPTVTVCLFIFLLPLLLPLWQPAKLADYYNKAGSAFKSSLKWEDHKQHPLPQDFADMLGWKEMAAKVEKAYLALPDSEKSKTMIFCGNYGQAGAIQYYSRGKLPVYTPNASFLFWMPDTYHLNNIIMVSDARAKRSAELSRLFSSVKLIDTIANPFAREYGTKITLLQHAGDKMNGMLEKIIGEQKDEFRR